MVEMYGVLKMDRDITDKHYISPGSYEIEFSNDVRVRFDFMDFEGLISDEDSTMLEFRVRNLDTVSFPLSEELPKLLRLYEITGFNEFFVDTEGGEEIHPQGLVTLTINYSSKDGMRWCKLDEDFCKKINVTDGSED